MDNKDFSTEILVNKSPKVAFNSAKNFRGWWSEQIEGPTDKLNEEFFYHYKDVHLCKLKLIEAVEDKTLVYLVLDNYFSFTKDKTEWKNTKLIFDISTEGDQTMVKFTHEGLVPGYECFKICHDAWSTYIKKSLYNFITTGKGEPNPKTGEGTNAEIVKKWKLK
jgi:hypothetical protein